MGLSGDGAEDVGLEQGHIAGDEQGEVVSGGVQGGFQSGQGTAFGALIGDFSPGGAHGGEELLVGSSDDDDVVGGLCGGECGPVEEWSSGGGAGGFVASQSSAKAAGEDGDGEGLVGIGVVVALGHNGGSLIRWEARMGVDGRSEVSGGMPLHEALGIARPALVATVGGGGKTTLLFALAQEASRDLSTTGLTVITTTTKMTIPPQGSELPLVLGRNTAFRAGALDDVQRRGLRTAIVGSGRGDRERLLAVDRSWPREALGLEGVELVAVEADGSSGRPFKAPADHEPVLPEGVDVVIAVVGASVLGRRLDGEAVHRPERVCGLTGASEGDEVTASLIGRVLSHAEGGRKGVPLSALFVVAVTGAARDREGSGAIGRACGEAGVERVVLYDQHAGEVLEVLSGRR